MKWKENTGRRSYGPLGWGGQWWREEHLWNKSNFWQTNFGSSGDFILKAKLIKFLNQIHAWFILCLWACNIDQLPVFTLSIFEMCHCSQTSFCVTVNIVETTLRATAELLHIASLAFLWFWKTNIPLEKSQANFWTDLEYLAWKWKPTT